MRVARRFWVREAVAVRWIVDGMNLIGSRPDGWWRDRAAARGRLLEELASLATDEVTAVEVVFDGRTSPEAVAQGERLGIDVSFAPGGPDAADRVIADRARTSTDPAATTVVTSDARLVASVRAAGVAVVGVSAFRRMLEGS
jgi:predicted RNA-binding protein with PIN domain